MSATTTQVKMVPRSTDSERRASEAGVLVKCSQRVSCDRDAARREHPGNGNPRLPIRYARFLVVIQPPRRWCSFVQRLLVQPLCWHRLVSAGLT